MVEAARGANYRGGGGKHGGPLVELGRQKAAHPGRHARGRSANAHPKGVAIPKIGFRGFRFYGGA